MYSRLFNCQDLLLVACFSHSCVAVRALLHFSGMFSDASPPRMCCRLQVQTAVTTPPSAILFGQRNRLVQRRHVQRQYITSSSCWPAPSPHGGAISLGSELSSAEDVPGRGRIWGRRLWYRAGSCTFSGQRPAVNRLRHDAPSGGII